MNASRHNISAAILAIETSCDETAAAVLRVPMKKSMFPRAAVLSSVVKSQVKLHSKMGGVIPEAAARAHVKNILPVVKKALLDAKAGLRGTTLNRGRGLVLPIDYIAVTAGPGLAPSLIVGVEFAKALSLATGTPVISINHMAGHLYSPLGKLQPATDKQDSVFPQVALIVSGGHTMLVLMKNLSQYEVLGQTVDDAAGEAFDKVAKLLGLPYPGGPVVSRLAEKGRPNFIFPRPMMHSKDYNFSFSGLKTAVLYYVQKQGRGHPTNNNKFITAVMRADICKAFQDAAIDVLVTKTFRAAKEYKAKSISLSGGVSANTALQSAFKNESKRNSLSLYLPAPHLSTDNAEMIGMAAAVLLHQKGFKLPLLAQIKVNSNLLL